MSVRGEVIYRLPFSDEIVHLKGRVSTSKENPKASFLDKKGFIFAPFDISGDFPIVHISRNTEIKSHYSSLLSSFEDSFLSTKKVDIKSPVISDWDAYKDQTESLLSEIEDGNLEKAVLSRVMEADIDGISLHILLHRLIKEYRNAFVYAIYTEETGIWMGATPELLLKADQETTQTMSLAGTQHKGDLKNFEAKWGEKEKLEQLMVTNYISDQLKKIKVPFTTKGPFTISAGEVMHLQTLFEIETKTEGWPKIVKALHPTPAVCGFPIEESKAKIIATEAHDRSYYTGYLGPVNPQTEMQLFVNLRCMRLSNNKASLYLGGGITADSEAEKEWEETELKSRTLLAVIEKLRKLAS